MPYLGQEINNLKSRNVVQLYPVDPHMDCIGLVWYVERS